MSEGTKAKILHSSPRLATSVEISKSRCPLISLLLCVESLEVPFGWVPATPSSAIVKRVGRSQACRRGRDVDLGVISIDGEVFERGKWCQILLGASQYTWVCTLQFEDKVAHGQPGDEGAFGAFPTPLIRSGASRLAAVLRSNCVRRTFCG